MKYILYHILFLSMAIHAGAQKETFDLASYTPLKGWKKKITEQARQFTREDAAKGTYCLVTLYKSLDASEDAQKNFEAAWESLVKEQLNPGSAPEMLPSAEESSWKILSGYAAFESESQKGIALLLTATSFKKMINVLIITNTDTWQKEIDAFIASMDLKKPVVKNTPAQPQQTIAKANPTGKFQFSTTNFDDGWIATEQADWVQVIKGAITVLIHYPNKKADTYNSVLLDGLKNGWDILVSPRYSNASGMEFKPITGWESIEYAEATMVEKGTGKTVFVVLFKKNYSNGSGKYLEFITPDKNTFEKEFGPYRQESFGWEKMEKMANYNKFAVAASDLQGKWTSDFSGAIQYVNAYTGFDAGMNTHSSSESFKMTGNSYHWDLAVASGMVGNIKFQSRKSSGKFSMTGNWKVNFSDIEGKPRTYDVWFSCIKGLRILWIDNRPFAKAE